MKAVIAAVVLAIVLGCTLYVVNRGGSAKSVPAGPVLVFHPTAVASIRFTPNGQSETSVQRSAEGGWVMPIGAIDWPLNPSGPQDFLGRLAIMSASRVPGGRSNAVAEPANPFQIVLAMRDGVSHTIKLSEQPVGGLIAGVVGTGRPFMTEVGVLDAARTPGPMGWRVTSALPGMSGTDIARVTITAGETTLGFAREGNLWTLRRPVAARADQRAVNELIGRLGRLGVERFIDKPTAADRSASGLDRPRMVINAERDVRVTGAGGTVRTDVRTRDLYVGGAATPAGTAAKGSNSVYGSPDRAGTFLLVMAGDALTSISTTTRAYLATTATDVSPAEVSIVSVRRGDGAESGYRRQLGKWVRMASGAQPEMAVEQSQVESLLTFLATQNGEPEPVLPGREDGLRTLVRITLVGLEGDTLDVISLGYNADGVLGARSGNLVVLYPGQTPASLLGLPAFADLPPLPNETRRVNPAQGDPTK